jgi:hypothetical protein
MDVIEHFAVAGIGLGQTLHEIDELARHRVSLKSVICRDFAGADVAAGPSKSNVFSPFTTDEYWIETIPVVDRDN